MKMVLLLAEKLVCVHSVQMIQTLCVQGHQADGSLRLFVPGLISAQWPCAYWKIYSKPNIVSTIMLV